MKPNYVYKAKVIKITDGDTVLMDVDFGMKIHMEMPIRLFGINTAEIHSKDEAEQKKAVAAKTFLDQQLIGKEIFIKTEKSDKYGRWLGVIYVGDNDKSVNQMLLEADLAKPYFGQGEKNF